MPANTTDPNNPDPNAPATSDVRVVSYWIEPGKGLCRQEIMQATSTDAQPGNAQYSYDPSDPSMTILAPEVKNMTLQYFDGTNMNDTWDGTQLGADGLTPIGSPLAIVLTMDIATKSADPNEDSPLKTYRHVIAIPTANGTTTSALSASSSSTGSSSTGSSSTGSSTSP